MSTRERLVAAVLGCLLLAACSSSKQAAPPPEPLRIAVLMEIDGRRDLTPMNWAADTINRLGGVANGRPLELLFFPADDPSELPEIVQAVIDDESIVGVIGPGPSDFVWDAAPRFTEAEKVMISPSSAAEEIARAFSDSPYVWRVTQSDSAQTEAMLLLAKGEGAERVALLTGFSRYSESFFNGFGFLAVELGFAQDAVSVYRYEQDADESGCHAILDELLREAPELLFAVPETAAQQRCIVRELARLRRDQGTTTRLVFSDAGYDPALLAELGDDAEGVEGLTLRAPPDNGFEVAYGYFFDADYVPNYAANMYDSVLLMAYALEHSGGKGGKALAESMEQVVSFRGTKVEWDASGIRQALALIREGKRPDISGATGTLTYDSHDSMDLLDGTYGHFRVELGQPAFLSYLSTADSSLRSRTRENIVGSRASLDAQQAIGSGDYEPAEPKRELWALLLALSHGWDNYRHQADVLAQYQALRALGLSDERIILVTADDLANHPKNELKGKVRNEPGGDDLHVRVKVDYEHVTATQIRAILAGDAITAQGPVLETGPGSNVYIFVSGHGADAGMPTDAGAAEEAYMSAETFFTPALLRTSLCGMHAAERYRRMFVVVEACHSGVFGREVELGCLNGDEGTPSLSIADEAAGAACALGGKRANLWLTRNGSTELSASYPSCNDESGALGLASVLPVAVGQECPAGGERLLIGTDLDGDGWLRASEVSEQQLVCRPRERAELPGVLVMTAASPDENSLAYGYDRELRAWTADQFAYRFLSRAKEQRSLTMRDFHDRVYLSVAGSHVSLYNAESFGDLRSVKLSEFFQ